MFTLKMSLTKRHLKNFFFQKFFGDNNTYRVKRNALKSGVVAQFVRFVPEEWNVAPKLRVEIYGIPSNPFPGNNL